MSVPVTVDGGNCPPLTPVSLDTTENIRNISLYELDQVDIHTCCC